MAASTFMPDVTVEIAFDSGYTTPAASRTWTDVSAYVEAQDAIAINRGRQDELSEVAPSTCTITLDNRDGRFTPGYAAGANYPNVKKGRPVRVSAVWPLGGGGTTYRRFTGYIEEWPVQWPDATNARSTVTITATSRMARLGRNQPLKSALETDVLADDPYHYFTLGDAKESRAAFNAGSKATLARLLQRGTGGTAEFASATGPRFDGLGALQLTPASSANGKYLRAGFTEQVASTATDHLSLEAWFSTTTPDAVVAAVGNVEVFAAITVEGGTARYVLFDRQSNTTSIGSPTVDVDDAAVHQAVLKFTQGSLNNDLDLYIDGVLVDSDTNAFSGMNSTLTELASIDSSTWIGTFPTNQSSALTGYGMGTIAVSHVALYNTDLTATRIADHYSSGVDAYEGDTSGERIERIAEWAGVPTAEVDAESGKTDSLAPFSVESSADPLAAMLDVARTENGLLFDAGDGTLTFHGRDHRYLASSVLTLNASTQEVEADFAPKLDDFGLINDATVTNEAATVRVVNQSSVDDAGTYAETKTSLTTSEGEVEDYANYLVGTYGEPQVRVPSCSVQLMGKSSAQITAVLAVELDDMITITNLPAQAPSSTMTFFVEGIAESIQVSSAGESWVVTFNLSPGDISGDVWILGTSQLGTDTVLAY